MHKFNWQIIRLTLFSCLAFFAGCSITEKQAQLRLPIPDERSGMKSLAQGLRSSICRFRTILGSSVL